MATSKQKRKATARKLTPHASRAAWTAIDQRAPAKPASNIDGSEVTAFVRHGGDTYPAKIDGEPPDPWRVSVEFEEQDAAPHEADPPVNFSHFTLELLRPDPMILRRIRGRQRLRKSDWWLFTFEGDNGALVRRTRAIVMLTTSAFARDEGDERKRELRRWIALHYLAHTSPVLAQSARGDAPEDKAAPIRRLDHLNRDEAASVLWRDLRARPRRKRSASSKTTPKPKHRDPLDILDLAFIRATLDDLQGFLDRLNLLPDESLSRQVVDSYLGLRANDEDDAQYAAMPDLTDDERAEMKRLMDLAMRLELDPAGQDRLVPLLKRNLAHMKARRRDPARFHNIQT